MSDPKGGRTVVLYGPPASGKSTITKELEKLDSRFRLFRRLKAGDGRVTEYRATTRNQIKDLQAIGEAVWVNERYGSLYAIDRPYLWAMIEEGCIPVLNVGQRDAADSIVSAVPNVHVTTVNLTCPRGTAIQRIADRKTGDIFDRVAAYDATEPFADADLVIDTSAIGPVWAAEMIADKVLR